MTEHSDVAAAVKEVQNAFVVALTTADIAALDDLLVDDYLDTEEGGHRSGKSDLVAVLKSGDLRLTSITISDARTVSHGTSAIMVGTAAQTGTAMGQSIAPVIVFTDTFVLTGGGWKVAASHRTVAPR